MRSILSRAAINSLAALSMSLLMPLPAAATVVTYTNFAAFNAALQSSLTYNFNGIATSTGFVLGTADVDGFLFSAPLPAVFGQNYNDGGPSAQAHYGMDYFTSRRVDLPPPAKLKVDLGVNGFSAAGFFLGSFSDANASVDVALNTGDSFSLQSTPTNIGYETNFIGFISDSSNLKIIDFKSSANFFDVTQFVIGTASPPPNNVPLPSSLLLLAIGIGFGALRKSRKGSRKIEAVLDRETERVWDKASPVKKTQG